ncbi:MAG: Eco47II family restriction endonuclease [Candidatus Porifericomitaceae bacterium WSBS_2022_MAG_OTU9]
MAYLPFISDEDLKQVVQEVLDTGVQARNKANNDFERNVIDPFAILWEMASFGINEEQWRENEICRQMQKSLANSIGLFHQRLLGKMHGWEDVKQKGAIDLLIMKQIIAAKTNIILLKLLTILAYTKNYKSVLWIKAKNTKATLPILSMCYQNTPKDTIVV